MDSAVITFGPQYVAVANQCDITFYHAATLAAARISTPTDAHIVSLFVVSSSVFPCTSSTTQYLLFVADAAGRLNVLDWNTANHIDTINLAMASSDETAPTASKSKGRSKANNNPAGKSLSPKFVSYFVAPSALQDGAIPAGRGVLVIGTDYGMELATLSIGEGTCRRWSAFSYPSALSDCGYAIGSHTGLAAAVQRGQKWLRMVDCCNPKAIPEFLSTIELPICAATVAVHPYDMTVAVGGNRGEMLVYLTVTTDPRPFSEHWHHTPVTSLLFSVDGITLYSSAAEPTLLTWNTSQWSFRKLYVGVQPVHCLAVCESSPHSLVIAADLSTLAVIDLLERRTKCIQEEVVWSSQRPCRGIVVVQWNGRRCVALLGKSGGVQLYDPVRHQSVYCLRITNNLETVPDPPESGVRHAVFLDDGQTIITHEVFQKAALPSVLRWWRKEGEQHVQMQVVYHPHNSDIFSILPTPDGKRVFTVSDKEVLEWGVVVAADGAGVWRNTASMSLGAGDEELSSAAMSHDGSVLFLGTSVVLAYDITHLEAGKPWTIARVLEQHASSEAITQLVTGGAQHTTLVGASLQWVHCWSLQEGTPIASVRTSVAVIVAIASGAVACLGVKDEASENSIGWLDPTTGTIEKKCLSGCEGATQAVAYDDATMAVVTNTGFRLVELGAPQRQAQKAQQQKLLSTEAPVEAKRTAITAFVEGRVPPPPEQNVERAAAVQSLAQRCSSATKWLESIVGDSATSVPPMASVLHSYLNILSSSE